MEKRKFDKLQIKASLLGFGAMRLPCLQDGKVDYEKTEKLIDMALAGGINYFDTAWLYHKEQSERILGKALVKRYPRDKYYIATKLPSFIINTPEQMEQCFNDHFERLQTDYIDFYLLHNVTLGSWQKLKSFGYIPFIERKRAEGKVRYLGFSTHASPSDVEKIVSDYDWDFAQLQINYMDWDDQGAKTSYDIVKRAELPLIVMEPIRGGGLADTNNPGVKKLTERLPHTTPAAIALRWVAGLENVKVVLSGMNTESQMEENMATFKTFKPLDEKELAAVDEAGRIIRSLPTIPCTLCEYCRSSCPKKINIPQIFLMYNSYIAYNIMTGFRTFYAKEHPLGRSAADCIRCGACARQCPQKIDIPEKLKAVAALYEEYQNSLRSR